MRVKVCGLTTAADRDCAVRAGADAVGFVSAVPVDSPREVPPDRARELVADTPPFVTSVLVTMPDGVAAGVELVERVQPDVIQVHGCAPATVTALRERVAAKVIAGVDADAPLDAYADAADAVLLDSTDESGAGGTGETHDWDRARTLVERLDAPVVLAGGLTPENVADAVAAVRPFGVDVASGVEREGGVKDHDAVRAFVERARLADHDREGEVTV